MPAFDTGTRNDATVKSGRLLAQTLLAEEHARDALADAQQTPHGVRMEAVRMATEALDFAAVRLDAAILDFAETIKESWRAELARSGDALAHSSAGAER